MRRPRFPQVLLAISLVVCTLFVFSSIIFWQWPDQYLHIIMCDVGQGDAILLTQGFTQVLVDAGQKEEAVLECLRHNLPFWDRQIEWIVPTHLDADHIGGFAGVLDRFVVKNMLLPLDTKKTADFERFELAVLREQQTGAQVYWPTIGGTIPAHPPWQLHVVYAPVASEEMVFSGQKIPTTETKLWDIKSASELNPKESNNRSTVLSFQFGRISLLLTGDMEAPVEQALAKRSMVGEHTILKVGHHGSKSSSSEVFLQAVRPEIALVSAGQKNRYGHPSPLILERLSRFGVAHALRTDVLGTVELISDGQRVWQHTDHQQKPTELVSQ